jgi:predicted nucleic acid-binding protein
MATLLLDTSVIIDAINEKRNRNKLLLDLTEQQGHILACCAISVTEVYAGMRPKEEPRTTALLRSLRLYPITFAVAELAGRLKREYGKKGITLATTDVIIAAVAVEHQLSLITDNTKDFPMKNLKLHPLPEN